MNQHDEQQSENPAETRLPYEPPAVLSEEVFETLALSCAKANALSCPGGNPDRS
ncbi:hypothetical protein [Haliangium ochraceum]|uniref:Uncharacterized protein n=1 Tax=Haliangium ochraceum (strain DSM 14365 / JCM 11303 / SMP-2) TaxID=502025 RepID=D0LK53_HALO1|nr:hypothetical protein [Haliangium ochraceum]ACY13087.1 hypothetical protein Hoch_0446 [Haliangium ochraceum DSM 14365]